MPTRTKSTEQTDHYLKCKNKKLSSLTIHFLLRSVESHNVIFDFLYRIAFVLIFLFFRNFDVVFC